MYDKIETVGKSKIQHGKSNDRIYLMKLAMEDCPIIVNEIEKLAIENKYTKIFAKISESAKNIFIKENYILEAEIPQFYNGKETVCFFAKYYDSRRAKETDEHLITINEILQLAVSKSSSMEALELEPNLTVRPLTENDAEQLAALYKIVFKTYPFPIHETEYLIKTMNENIVYFGLFDESRLIAASSSEMDLEAQNSEMTDFATLPEHRGKSHAVILLNEMEQDARRRNILTAYTIARAFSPGMNVTFAKGGYTFTGTLINNTNIYGKIESMNIWYKSLK